jgi:carboxymethylenebutenolidase
MVHLAVEHPAAPIADEHGARFGSVHAVGPRGAGHRHDGVGAQQLGGAPGHRLRGAMVHHRTARHAQEGVLDLAVVGDERAAEPVRRAVARRERLRDRTGSARLGGGDGSGVARLRDGSDERGGLDVHAEAVPAGPARKTWCGIAVASCAMALRDYLVGEVADDFAVGLLSRREAVRRLGLLGIGAASATLLLVACGSDDGAEPPTATTTPPTTTPPTTAPATTAPATTALVGAIAAQPVTFRGLSGELQATYAAPDDPGAALLVIHENRGLTPHFVDLVGRFAADGYAALCVDLASPEGGTAALGDAETTAALGAAPLERLVGDLRAGIDELERRVPGAPVGAVGFCFGGGMAWQLLQAGEPRLAAVVPFYGPAPEDPDFGGSSAAVLGIYAELDSRVNASRDRAEAALRAAGLVYEIRTLAGADHAFFNDTGGRYNREAAIEAHQLVLDWFAEHLA